MIAKRQQPRRARTPIFVVWLGCALIGLLICMALLYRLAQPPAAPGGADTTSTASDEPTSGLGAGGQAEPLRVYCAAGLRGPVELALEAYTAETGRPAQLQFGGSNTLLSQLEVARTGDLFLAADADYLEQAHAKGLVAERLPVAAMYPVIAVKSGNPKQIRQLDDLLRDDVRTALGNAEQAAVGQLTRSLLESSGHWEPLRDHVTRTGVFKPTVPELANDVVLGSVDAAIVWNTTVRMMAELEAVRVPALDGGRAEVAVGVVAMSTQPTAALHLARYLTARDRGLRHFAAAGYEVIDGDLWADTPQLTFFCGSVNRRAVESVIRRFEQREGVVVNTVYNGCGILTAQMKSMVGQEQQTGFPDTYMACDRYYLETVQEWFQDDVDLSDAQVVIAVPRGNPAHIQSLRDLARPGVRVSVGQPDQCTIGVLTRNVLQEEGILDAVMANVVTQTASSAMLIPTVTTGSVDATLAYSTDTRAESDKVEAIPIDSRAATAIQPFAIARSSAHKQLSKRLLATMESARTDFEAAGFHFRIGDQEVTLPLDVGAAAAAEQDQ